MYKLSEDTFDNKEFESVKNLFRTGKQRKIGASITQ